MKMIWLKMMLSHKALIIMATVMISMVLQVNCKEKKRETNKSADTRQRVKK